MLTKNIMCEKLKDKGGTAMTADNPYRSLFKTPRQREVSRRNAEIASQFRREHKKGSDAMSIYEMLGKMYGLTTNYVGDICRRGVTYA